MAEFLNLNLHLNTRTWDLMAETWDPKVSRASRLTANRQPLTPALGRDGSPNRPSADGDADLVQDNGGLGEPALPKAASGNHPVSGFPLSGHHPVT